MCFYRRNEAIPCHTLPEMGFLRFPLLEQTEILWVSDRSGPASGERAYILFIGRVGVTDLYSMHSSFYRLLCCKKLKQGRSRYLFLIE